MFRSKGVVRKCWSMAWKPSSRRTKFSGPMAIISGSPMADGRL